MCILELNVVSHQKSKKELILECQTMALSPSETELQEFEEFSEDLQLWLGCAENISCADKNLLCFSYK